MKVRTDRFNLFGSHSPRLAAYLARVSEPDVSLARHTRMAHRLFSEYPAPRAGLFIDPGALPKIGRPRAATRDHDGSAHGRLRLPQLRCAVDSASARGTPRLDLGVAGPVFGSSATVVGLEGGPVKTSLNVGQPRALWGDDQDG